MRGKNKEVFFEGEVCGYHKVWTDIGMTETIEAVEGVNQVSTQGTEYLIWLDKRYEVEFVLKEIEAAILCKES